MSRFGAALLLASWLSGANLQEGSRPEAKSAAALARDLRSISLDAKHTYRVRDLILARGDIKLYLNEGAIGFFTPVAGRVIAALFTTEGAEAGDAELIVMPPQRSERASLASFTNSPNLDEHFTSALFIFTDNSAQDLLDELHRAPLREAPELAAELGDRINPIAREIVGQLDVALITALFDQHPVADGVFRAVISGGSIGGFDVIYDPQQREPVFVGRIRSKDESAFQLWTNFRSRHPPSFIAAVPRMGSYRLDTTVRPDLTIDVSAAFSFESTASDGRVIPLLLSSRLKVTTASIDGKEVEVFQHPSGRLTGFGNAETFLLISRSLLGNSTHHVELHYGGAVIRQTETGEYFVDDRNTWYPVRGPVFADFDLTFHCPEQLRLVSTGALVTETVENGIRTVHRKTVAPAALAGFNLGRYTVKRDTHVPYVVEVYSPPVPTIASDPSLGSQTASILDYYTSRWIKLPIQSLAISPIAGTFGQGFPGLIYLSSITFVKQESRSPVLRNPRFDAFFSELLLPHEIAHQWWGNIVRQADYRSAWITEAMANHSALEYIEHSKGSAARDEILESYRDDLTQKKDQKSTESAGPLDFGERLIDSHDLSTWHVILYEKGSWILQMLRQRLGDQNFRAMQLRLLHDYATRPLSNEDFREVVSSFVPAGQPDRTLVNFFDTWVYGTGIPILASRRSNRGSLTIEMSGVEDDFVTDVPLHCKGTGKRWVRIVSGSNPIDLPTPTSTCELPSAREFLYLPGRTR